MRHVLPAAVGWALLLLAGLCYAGCGPVAARLSSLLEYSPPSRHTLLPSLVKTEYHRMVLGRAKVIDLYGAASRPALLVAGDGQICVAVFSFVYTKEQPAAVYSLMTRDGGLSFRLYRHSEPAADAGYRWDFMPMVERNGQQLIVSQAWHSGQSSQIWYGRRIGTLFRAQVSDDYGLHWQVKPEAFDWLPQRDEGLPRQNNGVPSRELISRLGLRVLFESQIQTDCFELPLNNPQWRKQAFRLDLERIKTLQPCPAG